MRELIERLEEAKKSDGRSAVIKAVAAYFRHSHDSSDYGKKGQEKRVESNGDALKDIEKHLKAKGFKKSGTKDEFDKSGTPPGKGEKWKRGWREVTFKHPKLGEVHVAQDLSYGDVEDKSVANLWF
jgi:hypothetical protein